MKLRAATMEDARLLFDWRNDEETRKQSRNAGVLEFDSHCKWLATQIVEGLAPLIALDPDPVGTVRIAKSGEMSWTVAPEKRGQGYGTKMVKLAARRAENPWAEIKEDNIASRKIAEAAGIKFKILETA